MAIITRRSSSTNKTITFNGYTGDLVPEISDGLGKAPNPTALSVMRSSLAATHIGNYALFGGGMLSTLGHTSVVDAYDTSLNRTTPTSLSAGESNLAATHIGDYALFGGGMGLNVVSAYDTSLNRTTTTALSVKRWSLAATHIGNYALFGGGFDNDNRYAVVDAYDTSLTRTTPTDLSVARGSLAATHIGDYALFGGGRDADYSGDNSYYSAVVDAYDTSLNRTTPTPLSVAREILSATHVGDYALFGGGSTGGNKLSSVVDAYDTSLSRTTPTPLSVARGELAATHVGNYALFGGGYGGGYSAVVDAYDTSLNRTTRTPLSVPRQKLAATHIGDYALFGGGLVNYTNPSTVVDAYTTKVYKATITLPPNVSYEFDGVSGTTTEPTDVVVGYPVYGSVTV